MAPGPAQTEQPDGGLDLTIPVADLREITMKVLSFGADVTVLEPEQLRRRVAEAGERRKPSGVKTGVNGISQGPAPAGRES